MTRPALSRYKLKMHGHTAEERYQCPYCPHVGSRAYDVFNLHIRKEHRERTGSTCLNDTKCVRKSSSHPYWWINVTSVIRAAGQGQPTVAAVCTPLNFLHM